MATTAGNSTKYIRDKIKIDHTRFHDLYKNCPADRQELITIKTYYEALFTAKGEDIKYVCFKLK
ncbi:MAG: hypothetical protein ACXVNM_13905 [Bacteroidia bacterium]